MSQDPNQTKRPLTESEIHKRIYDVEYKKMKEQGYPFHPFATWKDIVVAMFILLLLLGFTALWGVHFDAPANPTSQFLPRPEWYFMFLFQLLKYFPGLWAIFPVAIIPGAMGAVLVLLPFFDRNPYRSWKRRPVAVSLMIASMLALTGLTVLAYVQDHNDPHAVELQEAADKAAEAAQKSDMFAGPDGATIFASTCAACHGAQGTNIPGVALLDKAFISSHNVEEIVTNGTSKGMPSFKGKLQPEEIKAVAAYLNATAK
ncbi:MAG: cytochrome c class [Cyanobacteria bacterium RYN_339]|nr:cytochrome c class [Cyanobacteria bacterium RYN_339]